LSHALPPLPIARRRTCVFAISLYSQFCAEGVRDLGPWVGDRSGEVEHLKLEHRAMLERDGFVLVHTEAATLNPEVVITPASACPSAQRPPEVVGVSRRHVYRRQKLLREHALRRAQWHPPQRQPPRTRRGAAAASLLLYAARSNASRRSTSPTSQIADIRASGWSHSAFG
jgi:hypothetical protein